MSKKKKLIRYAAVKEMPNVVITQIKENRLVDLEKVWDRDRYVNGHDITLELGCGRAAYTLGLARKHPGRFFIGVDIKSDRILTGAGTALSEGLENVLFLRTRIDHLTPFFPEKSISEIWITFPDPHPTKKGIRQRLTSPRFLDIYRSMLKDGGVVHLKTDDLGMFEYTREVVLETGGKVHLETDNLYGSRVDDEEVVGIKTPFEQKYLAQDKPIKYLRFSL